MHHDAHIACLQALVRDVLSEYDAIVFSDHRGSMVLQAMALW